MTKTHCDRCDRVIGDPREVGARLQISFSIGITPSVAVSPVPVDLCHSCALRVNAALQRPPEAK